MSKLTQERLKELLHYNPDSGDFIWLQDRLHNKLKGKVAGTLDKDGYILIGVDGTRYRAHRLAFLFMLGRWPVKLVDHKNTITSDNTWSNLRECDNLQNGANSNTKSNNELGVKGIQERSYRGKISYIARIKREGKTTSKSFKTITAAKTWLHETRLHLQGEFANNG